MKKIFFCAIALGALATNVNAQAKKKLVPKKTTVTAPVKSTVFKNLSDSFSYAAGMNIAESMKGQGITNLNQALVQKAMQDVFGNKKLLLTKEEANITLQEQLQIFAKKKGDVQKVKNDAFLNANKVRKGVTTLPDGLQYEILTAGEENGVKPLAIDTAVVDYVGTLTDGVEFESSIKRGEPATFPLNRVIPGWTEILQLMTKGAKWKVTIPSELGYGERGSGAIPANSVLVFEITLRDIKPAVKE
ncbi:MAG: FKBP-type peptidyl-prolyl cis-trans isomerase [Ferruginibacter sp.]